MIIDDLITRYLAANRKLTIPDFGTFIRKEQTEELVFIPFLKNDEGHLLSRLITSELGVNTTDAQTMIDEYKTSINNQLEQQSAYVVGGLGILKRDENRAIYLEKPVAAHPALGQSAPVTPPPTHSVPRPTPPPVQPTQAQTQPRQQPQPQAAEYRRQQPMTPPAVPTPTAPSASSQPSSKPYTPHYPASATPKRRSTDLFLIIAIVAALLALGAIVYGYLVDNKTIPLPTAEQQETVETVPSEE